MTTNIRVIIEEVGAWAKQQPWHPDRHMPELGIIEEVGEAYHCILKQFQGIRGYDDPVKFKLEFTDAIGDILVYLCHWCFLRDAYFTMRGDLHHTPMPQRQVTVNLCNAMARVTYHQVGKTDVGIYVQIASDLVRAVEELALSFEQDAQACLIFTWNEVKQRNWTKDKLEGRITATEASNISPRPF